MMLSLKDICKDMYERGDWPNDFTKSVVVPIQKKENAADCEDFRTLSLISHASKIVLRVITRRVEARAEEFL